MTRRVAGAFLVVLPFLALGVWSIYDRQFVEFLVGMLLAAAIMGTTFLGLELWESGKPGRHR